MKSNKSLLATAVALIMAVVSYGQISVSPTNDATALANELIGTESGVTIVSATYTGDAEASGTFSGGDFGISQGILLTTGLANNAVGPNTSEGTSTNNTGTSDPDLDELAAPFSTNDAAILEITFIPDGNVLEFTYVFASEEYNEYVCSSFNDAFGFFVDGGAYTNQNIALVPGTDPPVPVTINNINNGSIGSNGDEENCTPEQLENSAFFQDNFEGLNVEYDGLTVALTATLEVEPGVEYTIKLAIADAGDSSLDSGVFLEGQSFVSAICDAGDIFWEQIEDNPDLCPDQLYQLGVANTGEGLNDNYSYLITDTDLNIIAIYETNFIEITPGWEPGDYLLWGLSTSGTVFGLEVGENAGDLSADGCLELSNSLDFTILENCDDCDADGGVISTDDETTICVDDVPDPIDVSLEGAAGENMAWVITDAEANILAIADGPPFDFNDAGLGICLIWHLSWTGDLAGAEVGNNAATDLEGDCYDLSNPIEVNRIDCTPDFDCPELEANIGDDCMLAGALGTLNADCECVPEIPSDCENWVIYLADRQNDLSTIYSVDLSSGDAVLTEIATSEDEVHIAFNTEDGLIYAVNKFGSTYRTLDPVSGDWSEFMMLGTEVSEITTAVFNLDNVLLIGSQTDDEIYSVNLNTNAISLYDSSAPVHGGDLAFDNTGMLYLATRDANSLFEVYPTEVLADQFIGNVPPLVTGMALTETDQLLVSHEMATSLKLRNLDGSDPGTTFDLFLNGAPFSLGSGDIASGCAPATPDEGDCEAFSTFYVNHGPGVDGTDLYRVTFSGGTAVLDFLTNVDFEAHIAYNAMADIVYLVNANGSFIRGYDVSSNSFVGDLAINGGINQLFAIVYNPADGLLYVGDANDDEIFTVDLGTGNATYFADAPIEGGDLALQNGTLYLASRSGDRLFEISGGSAVELGNIPADVNGMAQANNSTGLIIANFSSGVFYQISAADGSVVDTYDAELDGMPFTLLNGDMAAGCADPDGSAEGCTDFRYYYVADNTPGIPQGTVYEGEIVGNDFVLTELFSAGISSHIAVDPASGDIYVINSNGNNLRTYASNGALLNDVNIGLNNTVALVYNPADGMVYAGSASQDEVYMINPLDGTSSVFASNVPVNGGDLVLNSSGELFLIERQNNGASALYNISTGTAVFVADVATAINGAAITDTDGFIMAEGLNSNNFHVYDASGAPLTVLNAIYSNGDPFPVVDGDMASGCFGSNPVIVPGDCYATEVLEYAEGVSSNGGSIAFNRTDATQALGEPERVDQLVFVSLGYDDPMTDFTEGSLTLGFGGSVPNEAGDDLEIVETTYNNNSCGSYFEYADVYVSLDTVNWFFAKTVCRSDNFVDISDAGDFDYINVVKIVNNNELSTTPDAFDVDGVVAIHNCEIDDNGSTEEFAGAEVGASAELTSFPNPTSGPSQVMFTTAATERTVLEVYDMSGRSVETLFNQVAQEGREYRIDFNGSPLPNGIYIYKLSVGSDIIIQKFMINR